MRVSGPDGEVHSYERRCVDDAGCKARSDKSGVPLLPLDVRHWRNIRVRWTKGQHMNGVLHTM